MALLSNDGEDTIEVSVTMGAPSFVPGSRVSACIAIRSIRSPRTGTALSKSKPGKRIFQGNSLSGTSPQGISSPKSFNESSLSQTSETLSSPSFSRRGSDDYSLIDYVVCEISGRWTSDRSWVAPDAHVISEDILDNHLLPPVLAQASSQSVSNTPPAPGSNAVSLSIGEATQESSRTRNRWDAALEDANKIGGGGRLGYAGIIFRSQTLVVCEQEQIPAGTATSFSVECVLPNDIPPTFRGTAMRYMYACIVVVALPNSSTPRSIRVPFRIVSAGGYATDADRLSIPIPVPTPKRSGPISNRFLEREESNALAMSSKMLKSAPPDDIEIALALSLNGRLTPYTTDEELWKSNHGLEDGGLSIVRDSPSLCLEAESSVKSTEDVEDAMQRSSSGSMRSAKGPLRKNIVPIYAITRGKDSIARMYLPKCKIFLGDTISAVFYFQKENPCLRLGARLEAHEVVKPQYALGTKHNGPQETGIVFRKVYGEHGEFVMHNRNTHVTFSIPHDAPTSFSTDVVAVKWLIHFVFLIPQAPRTITASRIETDMFDETDLSLNSDNAFPNAEIVGLLDDLIIHADSTDLSDIPGWEGGTWVGEDPASWRHIPGKEVDVLRWTLPLHVTGELYSQWGKRSSSSLTLTAIPP